MKEPALVEVPVEHRLRPEGWTASESLSMMVYYTFLGGFIMSLSSYAPRFELIHSVWKSPLGPMGLVIRDNRLAQIALNVDPQAFPFQVERTFGAAGTKDRSRFQEVCTQLEAYFAGRQLVFRIPLDIDLGTPFQRRVWKALQAIPYGRTMTYRGVAEAIGQPSAVRAVGGANGMNPLPIVIPCHRVVAADGLGGFSGGIEIKKKLLDLEAATCGRAIQLGMLHRRGTGDSPRT